MNRNHTVARVTPISTRVATRSVALPTVRRGAAGVTVARTSISGLTSDATAADVADQSDLDKAFEGDMVQGESPL